MDKIDTLHKYIMVNTIHRELSHVLEDADSLLSFVTDGNDAMAIDAETAILTTRVIRDLIEHIKKWKSSFLDRLED